MNEALRIATFIGLPIKEFYYMTPYEFSLSVKGYNERKKSENEAMITQAYLTAAWQRAKKMPKLEKVLRPQSKKMTPEQMFKIVEGLNKAIGGTEKRIIKEGR